MTTSVSHILHIRKTIQDNSVLNNIHVRSVLCDVLLLCRKQLHDSIISIRRQDRAHTTRSIPQLIIVAYLPSLASIHMCLRGTNLCFVSTIFLLKFGIIPEIWYVVFVPHFITSTFLCELLY